MVMEMEKCILCGTTVAEPPYCLSCDKLPWRDLLTITQLKRIADALEDLILLMENSPRR